MNTLYRFTILAALLGLIAACQLPPDKKNTAKPQLKVGQIWKYHTRENEYGSTCTILKIEEVTTKKQQKVKLVHVSIDGVMIFNIEAPEGYTNAIGHIPCSENSVVSSVTELIDSTSVQPDLEDGYAVWRKSWDAGRAGYFTLPLKEVVEIVDRQMKSKLQRQLQPQLQQSNNDTIIVQ